MERPRRTAAAEELWSERLTFASPDEVWEAFLARGWTDGLPIVPPTEDKVWAMIAGAGRPAAEVIGQVPPRWAEATVEIVAVNAVMAGCRPEAMPVLLAALEAVCDPAFGLYSVQSTTHPCGALLVVSGPVAREIGLNAGHGAFGPGHRANATLGRALRLVLINVGGGVPGAGDMSTQGSPGKYTYCIAENEADSPWAPFRTTLGYGPGDSTVTVFPAESPHNINDHLCTSAADLLVSTADVMASICSNNASCIQTGDVLVAFGPEHAATLAGGGFSRRDVQAFLFERARNRVGRLRGRALWGMMGRWPDWIDRDDDEFLVPIVGRPEDIHVLVCGGSGKHSSYIPTFGVTKSVTRRIARPGA